MGSTFRKYESLIVIIFSVALAGLVTFIKIQFPEIGTGSPFLLYIFVVIVSAYFGGIVVGFASLIVTTSLSIYFFMYPPETLLVPSRVEQFQTLVYVIQGSITITILAVLRRIRLKLANANRTLEERVENRTNEIRSMMKEMRILNEKLQKSNAELEDFAYVSSHDLQEPLRKIQSFAHLLQEELGEKLDKENALYLSRIVNAANRMRNLIDDLLNYSRLKTEQKPFRDISLNKTIDDIISDMELRIKETKSDIKVNELPHVWGDETQLYQLFQNLITNAIRYRSPDRKTQINISGTSNETTASIAVKDNGIGFDEVYKDRIFAIFERLHGKHEYEGTGIGLAIVKKIVTNHNGSVDVTSKVGKGTIFTISLPISQQT